MFAWLLMFQVAAPQEVLTAPVACSVADIGDKVSGVLLQARCGQNKTMIGAADRYQIKTNPRTGSAAVSLTIAGVPQVLLVYADDQGVPVIQDVTAALARSIGRAPERGLAGAEIDLAAFAQGEAITATENDSAAGVRGRRAQVDMVSLRAVRMKPRSEKGGVSPSR